MKARQRRAGPLSLGGRLSMQAVEPDGVWAATLAVVEFSKVSHGAGNRYVTIVSGNVNSAPIFPVASCRPGNMCLDNSRYNIYR